MKESHVKNGKMMRVWILKKKVKQKMMEYQKEKHVNIKSKWKKKRIKETYTKTINNWRIVLWNKFFKKMCQE